MKKIGILGGTFDPVHNGHLLLAREAKKQANLNEIIFMPAKLQPFKLDKKVTAAQHRLAMLTLAIAPIKGFSISSYELESPEISYTCNTLRAMRKKVCKEDEIYFISGTDAFLKIRKWKGAEELLTSYRFIVGARPGYKDWELTACIEEIRRVYNTNIIKVDSPMLNVSSTEIRTEITKDLVPAAVERYIKEHGLY